MLLPSSRRPFLGAIAQGHRLADRACELLKQSVRDGTIDFRRLDTDPGFDPIRDNPAFADLSRASSPGRRYCAVWSSGLQMAVEVVEGISAAEQRSRSEKLVAQGFRPVGWSVARTSLNSRRSPYRFGTGP